MEFQRGAEGEKRTLAGHKKSREPEWRSLSWEKGHCSQSLFVNLLSWVSWGPFLLQIGSVIKPIQKHFGSTSYSQVRGTKTQCPLVSARPGWLYKRSRESARIQGSQRRACSRATLREASGNRWPAEK